MRRALPVLVFAAIILIPALAFAGGDGEFADYEERGRQPPTLVIAQHVPVEALGAQALAPVRRPRSRPLGLEREELDGHAAAHQLEQVR